MSQIKRERVTTFYAEAQNGERSEVCTSKKDATQWKRLFKKASPEVLARVVTEVNVKITRESPWK